MATHRCEHRHTLLEHPQCWRQPQERLGFLDIEASNLVADFGIMLSYAIKEFGSDRVYSNVIQKKDIEKAHAGDEDKKLVQQCMDDIRNFDRIITFYGARFDVPFMRTRALSMDIPFPLYGEVKHTDLYFAVKHKLRMSSNRLENASRVILGKTEKTRVDAKYWRAGQRGEKKALAYILDHNIKDVLDLEKLYVKMLPHTRRQDSSI
jgi:uncharacterized protein YprB with RNaseH-like and TPR domain